MLDNVAVMIILFAAVTSTDPIEQQVRGTSIRFTPEFVLTRMIPGTALGVLLGDLVYTWMAFRLARRTGRGRRDGHAAGPGHAQHVRRRVPDPAAGAAGGLRAGTATHEAAMQFAWHVGLVTLVLVGRLQGGLCAPFGNAGPPAGAAGRAARLAGGHRPGADRLPADAARRHRRGAAGRHGVAAGHPRHAGGAPRAAGPSSPARWRPCWSAW